MALGLKSIGSYQMIKYQKIPDLCKSRKSSASGKIKEEQEKAIITTPSQRSETTLIHGTASEL